MKKNFFWISGFFMILGFLLVCVINYRTPFFVSKRSGWSIGFGISKRFPEKMDFNKINLILKNIVSKDSTNFIADPFWIESNDSIYIFFENQSKYDNGTIGVLASKDGKKFRYEKDAIKEAFHMSYPQVFQKNKKFYMLPETQASGHVLLYEAVKFPYKWKICDTLIKNCQLKDPTIYLSDSINLIFGAGKNLDLNLYVSNSLFGKWELKQKEILKGTESRPGGRIINYKGKLLLPIQNCSEAYGYGLSLYTVDKVRNTYKLSRIKPFYLKQQEHIKEFNAGMHHLDLHKLENNFFYVYDGNTFEEPREKVFNYKGPLKKTYIDLKQFTSSICE
ncbi:glucosamine inositolphosphorylceramide transferase family protein [Flavobacterium columnare]|uniref:Glucosamine inositolphosphorylceramide transferase 1 N-terminal domain-containing protein n=1 Tax=Flavobacterium columnare TaxID=996 RepID=A0AAI8CJ47_9FLAO|nr:hypothetical protein [Flavobacterium columnare]AMO21192.1 hypothetical protein UN65_13375 [Flavobacterium columnare]AUX19207.1 hypothetical protein AQ623_13650 [Flavobacterium columnare]MEB3802234.1 hypothetical protein [Flavobacterium columnare]QOG58292.1 hypothetical protein HUE29_13430 [Flavobacterium columnare]QOG61015.1 hypothetical protein HUE30_13430 [Flavobacterium columnare]